MVAKTASPPSVDRTANRPASTGESTRLAIRRSWFCTITRTKKASAVQRAAGEIRLRAGAGARWPQGGPDRRTVMAHGRVPRAISSAANPATVTPNARLDRSHGQGQGQAEGQANCRFTDQACHQTSPMVPGEETTALSARVPSTGPDRPRATTMPTGRRSAEAAHGEATINPRPRAAPPPRRKGRVRAVATGVQRRGSADGRAGHAENQVKGQERGELGEHPRRDQAGHQERKRHVADARDELPADHQHLVPDRVCRDRQAGEWSFCDRPSLRAATGVKGNAPRRSASSE